MTLQLTIDTLDGVPEPLREFYEEKDGKFVLKVEGIEDTSGLKSALQKEREAAKEAKKYKDLGLTPDQIAELKQAADKADEDKARAAGEWDTLRQKLADNHAAELKKRDDRIAALEASEHSAVVKTGLMTALAEAGATEEGLALLPDQLKNRAKIEDDNGERVLKILDADGTTMIGKDGRDATFTDLVAKVTDKFPSLFKATVKPGSGKQPGGNGAGSTGRTVTRSQFASMSQAERKQHALDGGSVVND